MNYWGEIAAVATAVCWTGSAVAFEKAGKSMGALSLNVIRIVIAIVLLGVITLFTRGSFFPTDATAYQWFWLGLSGLVSFFIGNSFMYHSYTIIGARMGQLIMNFTPVITAFLGIYLLREDLSPIRITGILTVVAGVFMAVVGRQGYKFRLNLPFKGFLFAFIGAVGQAFGFLFTKKGIGDYDPVAATQIRAIAGFVGLLVLLSIMKHWRKVFVAVQNKADMKVVMLGSIVGPVIGVSLSVFAIQNTNTGVAATLIGLVPIFIIVPSAIFFKEKITFMQVLGAFISVGGSVLFFV
jgi:drug/metabolite transporter (DMT)-like permease